jgi:quinol-cytochrome oxidoreductase complex cytochrome b subunit
VVALTGALLAWRYEPRWPGPFDALGPDQRITQSLVRAHRRALGVAVPLALVATVIVAVARQPRRQIVASVVASLSAIVASMTWGLVEWDQVALAAVTVGTGMRGLWSPAVDDGVAFLPVDGAEIGQATYRRWLLVHLAAPLVGLVALGLSMWGARHGPNEIAAELAVESGDEVPWFELFPDDR